MKYINQYGSLKIKECETCSRAGRFVNLGKLSSTHFCNYYKYHDSECNCSLYKKRAWYKPKHLILKLW